MFVCLTERHVRVRVCVCLGCVRLTMENNTDEIISRDECIHAEGNRRGLKSEKVRLQGLILTLETAAGRLF